MAELNVNNFSAVGAYASQKAVGNAQEQAAISVAKTAIDQQADNAMQLLDSLNPVDAAVGNLGNNLNVRA